MTAMIALLYLFSVVMFTFIRHDIPSQKAHMICKTVKVPNTAIAYHINIRTPKAQPGHQKNAQTLTASEKHPLYKIFDHSVKSYIALYQIPFKTFIINPPKHNNKKYVCHCALFCKYCHDEYNVEERSQQYNFFSREIFHLYRHHQTLLFCIMYYTTMYYILYNTINVKYLKHVQDYRIRDQQVLTTT